MNLSRINLLYLWAAVPGVWGALGFLGICKRIIVGPQMDTTTLIFSTVLTAMFFGAALFLVRVGEHAQKIWDKQDGK